MMSIRRFKFDIFQDHDQRWILHPSSFIHNLFKFPFDMKVPETQQCDKTVVYPSTFINVQTPSFKALTSIFKMLFKLFHIYAAFIIISSFFTFPRVSADQHSAPHFIVQPSFAGGVVTEGQSKILQCQALGFPAPEYIWYKNNKPLGNFSQDPLLRIHHITKEDSGQYWCIAKNIAGTVFSDKTSLTVSYMGNPSSTEDISISIKDGEAAILNPPSVESVPPVSVSWQKIGFGRLHGINYAVTLDNSLVLLAASRNDEGQYQASIINPHAGEETSGGIVQLHVSGERRDSIPAEIIVPPKDTVFKQGTYPAVLECIVNARPLDQVDILWKKDGQDIAASGLSPHLFMLSPWNRTITLINVGTMHAGTYECEVFMHNLESTKVSAKAEVTIIVEPVITHGPSRETISEIGKAVNLPCSSTGNPVPDVIWYKNAEEIKVQMERFQVFPNGTLQISALSSSDTGIYQCVVKNSGGEASASTWLHVKVSAPDFIKRPVNVTVLDGKDAQINCEVSGAPAPNVTWIFNDTTEVQSVGRIQILESGDLLIASTEGSDVGKYTCIRVNSAGSVKESAFLSVLGEAVPTGEPREVRLDAVSSTEVKVSWKPPPPTLQNGDLLGYKIFYEPRSTDGLEEMEAVPPTTVSYVLLDLKKYTEYSIQILAFNLAGDGPRSSPQYITTMEDIPGPPGPLVFSDVTMTSLNVSWNPPVDPNGRINGYLVTYETALPDIYFSKQVKQKVTSASLSVHGLAEVVTYTFRVKAETFDYGPESVGNITTGPQEEIHM